MQVFICYPIMIYSCSLRWFDSISVGVSLAADCKGYFNTLGSEQNGHHFDNNTFKYILMKGFQNQISLTRFNMCEIYNKPSFNFDLISFVIWTVWMMPIQIQNRYFIKVSNAQNLANCYQHLKHNKTFGNGLNVLQLIKVSTIKC